MARRLDKDALRRIGAYSIYDPRCLRGEHDFRGQFVMKDGRKVLDFGQCSRPNCTMGYHPSAA